MHLCENQNHFLCLNADPSEVRQVSIKEALQKQPRRGRAEVISEFSKIVTVTASRLEVHLLLTLEKSPAVREFTFKNLRVTVGSTFEAVDVHPGESGASSVRFQLMWTPKQFFEEAKTTVHPYDAPKALPEAIAVAIFESLTKSPSEMQAQRDRTLKYYEKKLGDLGDQEAMLHRAINPRVEQIISSKQILLFKAMLVDTEYDDMGVVDLLVSGIRICGRLPPTGIWRRCEGREETLSVADLWRSAPVAQKRLMDASSVDRATLDHGLHGKLWEQTMTEAGEGSIRGPFTPEQIQARNGSRWVGARRFAIVQNEKLRPIDDFSQFGHNQTFGSEEKIDLKSTDHVAKWAMAWCEAVKPDGSVEVISQGGATLRGVLHEDIQEKGEVQLRGRVLDLRGAYKQLATHPADAPLNIIGVFNPASGAIELFEALALMFGASAAVYGFLRFSRALAHIALKLLRLVIVEFFDDFTQLELKQLGQSAQDSFEALLQLLGWRISSGEKRLPFSDRFVSLGVLFDFTRLHQGWLVLENKPGRIEKVVAAIEAVLLANKMEFKTALSIRGKVAFAEGQTHCRITASLCRLLSRWASAPGERWLTQEMIFALQAAVCALTNAGPRRIGPPSGRKPVLVFTDGACEDCTSVGGMIYDPDDNCVECFGAVIHQSLIDTWKTKIDQTQVIGQAEIFPVLVAKLTWQKRLANRSVLYFIDNEAARLGLVKAYSPVLPSLKIILQCVEFDYNNSSLSWYARVPTAANASDEPSRMLCKSAVGDFDAIVVEPVAPVQGAWSQVLRLDPSGSTRSPPV